MTKPPHYIVFKMEVADKTYRIKIKVATKLQIRLQLNFLSHILYPLLKICN
jgi:hypothetical protein